MGSVRAIDGLMGINTGVSVKTMQGARERPKSQDLVPPTGCRTWLTPAVGAKVVFPR